MILKCELLHQQLTLSLHTQSSENFLNITTLQHYVAETPLLAVPGKLALPAVRGDVEFEDVSFTFDRSGPVLDGVSFSLRAGETLAIVGPSGSGESTIADLSLRLLDPDRGTVRLDGHDLRQVRLADLRARVVLVDQEPFVFHASIAENLRYMRPDATQSDLEKAARAAGIAGFIAGLPQQFDTQVGERGAALRRASASASPSREPSWPTLPCWCWMSPRRRSILCRSAM